MRNTIYFKWFMDSLSESDKKEYEQMSINNQKNWYISYLENHYEPNKEEKSSKPIQLDTIGGYDEKTIANFNKVAKYFDDSGLLIEILSRWADDKDIQSITEHLEDRLIENDIEVK